MWGQPPSAVRGAQLRRLCQLSSVYPCVLCCKSSRGPDAYFLNRFSNAARASLGFSFAGVDVSFSRVTRISYSVQSLRASFLAIRSLTGCMHSKWLPGSKYVHCLHECNSNPHFGHWPCPELAAPCNTVPHCEQRETARVPGRFTGRGPSAWSQRGGPLLRSGGALRVSGRRGSRSLS
jgi:hypothetical protein